MHVDQVRDELLVGSKSRMGAEVAVEGNSLHAREEHLKQDKDLISKLQHSPKELNYTQIPEQMPRQPESLAVPGLHPDLIRPQLRIIILTQMVLKHKQYNSHFLAYSCTIFNQQ